MRTPVFKGLADALYRWVEQEMNRHPHRCWRHIMGVCYDCGHPVWED